MKRFLLIYFVLVGIAFGQGVSNPASVTGAAVTDRLIELVAGESYEITAATYDSDGVVTTATVRWSDGSTGTFTTTTKNATFFTIDAFTITHATSGKTVTQALLTRNSAGQVTSKPALAVSP